MEYDIMKLFGRVDELEKKVKFLESRLKTLEKKSAAAEKKSGRGADYRKLTEFLSNSGESSITLNYEQIEEILGCPLPPSATTHFHSVWSNSRSAAYARYWLNAGYIVKGNAKAATITFQKV